MLEGLGHFTEQPCPAIPSVYQTSMASDKKLTNMGWPEEDALWRYTSLTEPTLSSELARLSSATRIADTDCVTFQPCPEPSESSQDRYTVQDWEMADGVWSFRAIFDGHAGPDTAEYAVTALPNVIKERLASVLAHNSHPTPETISEALVTSISSFDNSIMNDLLKLFPDQETISKLSDEQIRSIINDSTGEGPNSAILLRCMRGSTVLVSLLDPSRTNLWVASLGDCQAVLGTKRPSGEWDASVISSCHNGRDTAEAQRVKREHPDEAECILNNRVLGAIAVTRAVGDHLFKLPVIYTRRVFMNAKTRFSFSTKIDDFLDRNITPPYLSNRADTMHVNLRDKNVEEARLIMFSDGLIDLYEERGLETSALPGVCVQAILSGDSSLKDNLALQLLWDGLGGHDTERVSRMMTVEMGFRWMDDTTILIQKIL